MTYQITSNEEFNQATLAAKNNNDKFWLEVSKNFKWQNAPSIGSNCDLTKGQAAWFTDGVMNITENCLDRHLITNPNKTALIWEGNDIATESKKISYQELFDNVCQTANLFKKLGVRKGDRVCLYMPMIVEAIYAMLAAARIGAVHSIVFAGFSAKALGERIKACDAKLIVTSDLLHRGNKNIEIVKIVDEAVTLAKSNATVLLYKRDQNSKANANHKIWQDEITDLSTTCPAEPMQAEDPFFILYTSGSTGTPKGIVHSCAGYMVYAGYSFANVFQPKEDDIYWCSADIGWITGHTYSVYGPLLNNLTTLIFEGVPTYPDASRFWQVIEKHNVNIFYTAPTAIRALMQYGDAHALKHEMKSLRTLGSVGEPINEEAWQWFYDKVGKKRCEIIDSWWQTETGGIMICNLSGVTKAKPSFATKPLPGIDVCLLDKDGNEVMGANQTGYLCVRSPWPSMIRTVWGDHSRCIATYFENFPGYYFTGDAAMRDELGNYRIIGRVDDVINSSGHRIGTAEVENAINQHHQINESAVIGIADKIKGEAICAFVICQNDNDNLGDEVSNIVKEQLGSFAKPDKIYVVDDLPKTRSGKIMRRILKKIVTNDSDLGDTSTLVNPDSISKLKQLLGKHG